MVVMGTAVAMVAGMLLKEWAMLALRSRTSSKIERRPHRLKVTLGVHDSLR